MTKHISIHDFELEVPEPYAEGHQLSAIEAKQLNQVFAENVANNMRSLFKKIRDGAEGAPTEAEARQKFAEYAANYKFTEASAGGGARTMTPLEKEAKKIATQVVINLLAKPSEAFPKGRKRSDIDKDKFDSEVARIAETDKVLKLATKNVREMENLASSEMENAA